MSGRSLMVVFLSVVCGVCTAFGVNRLRSQTAQAAVAPKPATTPIVVAAVAIPRGRVLCETDVTLRDWPEDMLPAGAVTELDEALARAAVTPLMPGEPLFEGKLASKDAGRGLAALVPKGMRAYTIQARGVASNVAGFVLPGNRVDILLTLKDNCQVELTGGSSTTTLLQAVEILAVGQQLDAPADNRVRPEDMTSVTLLVTPEQASLLDLGQSAGELCLSLRNPEDVLEAATRPALLADIRFRQEKPLQPVDDDAGPVVQAVYFEGPSSPPRPAPRVLTLRGSQWGYVSVPSGR